MFDRIIYNARIIDGSGNPSYSGDIGITSGSISAIGDLSSADAACFTDAGGRALTPGFIDIHRHGDGAVFSPDFGLAEAAQGLTTIVNGCCGMSVAPVEGPHKDQALRYLLPVTGRAPDGVDLSSLSSYRAAANAISPRINSAMLLGMGTLRASIAGFSDLDLTDNEYLRLHRAIEQTLGEGAIGVSLGLGYAPECFYSPEQLLKALAPLQNSGVVIYAHIRQEGDLVVEALEEMIALSRSLNTPVQISHIKSIGVHNWQRLIPRMLNMIDAARADGLDITCDVYPYTAGSTQLIHTLPPEVKSGGIDTIMEALSNPISRKAMRRRMESGSDFENIVLLAGFDNIQAISLSTREYRDMEGMTISEISSLLNKDPYDAIFDLLLQEECLPGMIDQITHQDDILQIIGRPYSMVASDATYSEGLCHPRLYGHVPRLIQHYTLSLNALSLEQAIRKITRLPADRLGLYRKGRIEVGADADICLFYPENIHETATFTRPRQLARGMDWVFVGGLPVIADGQFTDNRPGLVL